MNVVKQFLTRQTMRAALAALVVLGMVAAAAGAPQLPERVDLRPQQTPLRDQGSRATCIAHSSLAALEAAYRRAGYGDTRLSVEFAMYMTNLFHLQPRETLSPVSVENKMGSSQYGWSLDYVKMLARGFAVPRESDMPYLYRGYADREREVGNQAFQFNVSSFNLNPHNLPMGKLAAAQYYSVKSYWVLDDPTSPALFEQALAQGYEIVWDFRLSGTYWGKVWQYTGSSKVTDGAHSMLIVGYDREKKQFTVKNSWGTAGYTYISYDYLKYGKGYSAVCILEVNPPRAWTELAAIGRWYVTAGNVQGVLDIYHLPGMSRTEFERAGVRDAQGQLRSDRRIGTFYVDGDPLRAYRVNGVIEGKRIWVYIDWKNANLGYDALPGKPLWFEVEGSTLRGDGEGKRLSSGAAFPGAGRAIKVRELPEINPRITAVAGRVGKKR
jgi:C1A family cysteine protease